MTRPHQHLSDPGDYIMDPLTSLGDALAWLDECRVTYSVAGPDVVTRGPDGRTVDAYTAEVIARHRAILIDHADVLADGEVLV